MITGRASRLSPGAPLRRITMILALAVGGVLAWAAAVPAASAAVIPVPGAGAGYGPVPAGKARHAHAKLHPPAVPAPETPDLRPRKVRRQRMNSRAERLSARSLRIHLLLSVMLSR